MTRSAVLAAAAALLLAACGGTGGGQGEATGPGLAGTIGTAMKSQGHDAEASIATAETTRFTRVPAAFLGRWRIYQVDGGDAHAVQYSVGVGPGQVVLLTGNGAAFGLMAEAAGARVRTAAQAVTLAQVYLRTTRPTDVLAYTVGDVRQIRFRPGLSGADAARRDAVIRKYGPVVGPPRARPAPGGHTVTAYTVRDRELQRRTLEIGPAGTVKDRKTILEDDLPVPYTR